MKFSATHEARVLLIHKSSSDDSAWSMKRLASATVGALCAVFEEVEPPPPATLCPCATGLTAKTVARSAMEKLQLKTFREDKNADKSHSLWFDSIFNAKPSHAWLQYKLEKIPGAKALDFRPSMRRPVSVKSDLSLPLVVEWSSSEPGRPCRHPSIRTLL
jgi:hypothetical protein